jgi:chloramphenicol-sensitive protein RarD
LPFDFALSPPLKRGDANEVRGEPEGSTCIPAISHAPIEWAMLCLCIEPPVKAPSMAMAERNRSTELTEPQKGVIFLLIAHLIWGAMAYYIKLLDHVPPAEIAVHRGLWSLPFAAAMVLFLGNVKEVIAALRQPRTFAILAFCSALIVFNWGFYVWAIQVGRTAEAALGYYVNPLMNVLVGYLFLHERFTRTQALALVLVVIAVVVQTIAVGAFPWLGLSLAATFCLYGYIRKKVPVDSVASFFVEILILTPFALLYLSWTMLRGSTVFLANPSGTALLIGLGLFTAATLMLFGAGVKRVRYSTVGLLQYISPSIVFLTAVFIFREPMNELRWLSFVLIWIGLAVFSLSALREDRSRRTPAAATSAVEPV